MIRIERASMLRALSGSCVDGRQLLARRDHLPEGLPVVERVLVPDASAAVY